MRCNITLAASSYKRNRLSKPGGGEATLNKQQVREVFEENYEWFKRFLKVRYISLNDYDIEDLIQQTAMKLLRMGENIGGIKNLTSYVFRALENGARDHFRKSNRETLTFEYSEEGSSDLEDSVLAGELKGVIMKAINQLEPNQRYAFIETEIKGRSYEELAAETGEKAGTLLSRKSRAVKKLKEAVAAYINEGGKYEQ